MVGENLPPDEKGEKRGRTVHSHLLCLHLEALLDSLSTFSGLIPRPVLAFPLTP